MGWFSNLSINVASSYWPVDRSYPSPEEQLLWRYEDLLSRREELYMRGSPGDSGLLIDDIRYMLPEHLCSLGDVEAAIELAADDLMRKYHIEAAAVGRGKPQTGTCMTLTGVRLDVLSRLHHAA